MTEDEDDDPALRSMRSVWISMRDEDPPSSGLADLLAAARVKAEEMKPAPWWRRMFAVMARPPMLAAATVLVLVGGALVISQRGDHEPPRASQTPSEPPVLTEKAAVKADEPKKQSDADTVTLREEGEVKKPEPSKAPIAEETPPRVVTRPPRRSVDPPKPEPPPTDPNVADVAPPPPPPPPDDRRPVGGNGEKLEIAADNGVDSQVRAPEIEATRPNSIQPGLSQQQPPIDQLVKQAEVAASRKDCPAVRVTVKRIQQRDKNARDRVAKQPAVANCLK